MDPRFSLLLACFFVSGFAALLYQTVWSRELSFVFGTSELAVVAVLAAYMGGLALGAAAAARTAPRLRRPVLAYGALELAIAVSALLVPWGIRGINSLYLALLGGGSALPESGSSAVTLFQLAGATAVLLPPTAFMGATLPLLARHAVRSEAEIAPRIGLLYAVNTAGAIAGTLCAAFWLMPELGLRRTVWSGAALNALVFGMAALLARGAPLAPAQPPPAAGAAAAGAAFWILPAIAVSGAISFAYEVMWTRLLGHLLGSSLQAFASMLASFLLGIALGSAAAARAAATRERAALGFALSQLGIAATSYTVFALSDRLPELSAWAGAGPGAPLASAAVAGAALLPITLCIGATFPLAVRVLARDPGQSAVATARVYSWNTLGSIAGALGAGFVLLPELGFEGLLSAGVAASLALAALAALALPPRRPAVAGLAAAAALALALAPASAPSRLLSSSPLNPSARAGETLYSAVGRTSSVRLIDWGTRFQITTDGLPEASIDPAGALPEISVAYWLGALPALVRPEARDLLVVGFGGGAALELVPQSLEAIDVIELEPQVVEANRRIAAARARDPLSDPRIRIHLGDARGTLQLAARRYGAIVSQPSHPWTAGASHLYTREFFSLVRSRLEPDGVFVQWIGISFVDEALLRSLLSALLEAFPHVELFQPQVYGLLFVASGAPIDALAGAARALAAAPADFARLGLHRLEDVASAWALDEAGVRGVAQRAPPNTDDHNRLSARSAHLGRAGLSTDSLGALLDAHSPLPHAPGLDRPALIRALLTRRLNARASEVAMAGEGAGEEAGLGWVELAAGRSGRAARHFERALTLSQGSDGDALAGLVASRKLELVRGGDVPGIPERPIGARAAAVIAGWRDSRARDWSSLASRDAELASIRPGDPLFEEAAHLRIARMLAAGDPAAAAEAQALAETLLLRGGGLEDQLLRARAAIAAGRQRDARISLRRVANQVGVVESGRALAAQVLQIARLLPDEDFRAIQAELAPPERGPSRHPEAEATAGTAIRARPAAPEMPR